MRDRLDGVAVFVEAAESGGFARAADRLALTRSAVSKTIARLEARLGVRLFNRTTRTQSLTEDGQLYYERCLCALEELRKGESLLDSGRREVAGRLRVSMPILFGRYCVAPILLDMAREHPRLELELSFSDQVVDIIGERFDLAIRNGALGEGSELHARKIAAQRKVICAAPSYLTRRGRPRTIEDLETHDALVYWRNDQLYRWMLRDHDGKMREAALNWRIRFDNQEAIVDAVVAGLGLGWLPSWLVNGHVKAGRLVTVLDEFPAADLETFAVWPSSQYVPLRLRMAIDLLAEKMPAVASHALLDA